jgi:hypothetical protein
VCIITFHPVINRSAAQVVSGKLQVFSYWDFEIKHGRIETRERELHN